MRAMTGYWSCSLVDILLRHVYSLLDTLLIYLQCRSPPTTIRPQLEGTLGAPVFSHPLRVPQKIRVAHAPVHLAQRIPEVRLRHCRVQCGLLLLKHVLHLLLPQPLLASRLHNAAHTHHGGIAAHVGDVCPAVARAQLRQLLYLPLPPPSSSFASPPPSSVPSIPSICTSNSVFTLRLLSCSLAAPREPAIASISSKKMVEGA